MRRVRSTDVVIDRIDTCVSLGRRTKPRDPSRVPATGRFVGNNPMTVTTSIDPVLPWAMEIDYTDPVFSGCC